MSISAMCWAWRQAVSSTETLVLLALADYADEWGVCWPSIGTLETKTKLSDRSIQRSIRRLVKAGALSILAEGGGCRKSTRYRLNLDAEAVAEPEVAEETPPQCHPSAQAETPPQCHPSPDETPTQSRQTPTQSHPNHQEPPIKKEESPLPPEAGGSAGKPIGFEAFWKLYPRPLGEDAARRAWRAALRKGADPADIVFALETAVVLKRFDDSEGGRFIPYPAKWLRAGHWRDGLDAAEDDPEAERAEMISAVMEARQIPEAEAAAWVTKHQLAPPAMAAA